MPGVPAGGGQQAAEADFRFSWRPHFWCNRWGTFRSYRRATFRASVPDNLARRGRYSLRGSLKRRTASRTCTNFGPGPPSAGAGHFEFGIRILIKSATEGKFLKPFAASGTCTIFGPRPPLQNGIFFPTFSVDFFPTCPGSVCPEKPVMSHPKIRRVLVYFSRHLGGGFKWPEVGAPCHVVVPSLLGKKPP